GSSGKAYSPKLRQAARARCAPGLFCCAPPTAGALGRAQPSSVGAARRRGFIVSGLLFTMSFATPTCCRLGPCLARDSRLVFCPREAMNGRDNTSERKESHDQDLGAKHLGERAEGDVGGRRARAAA